MSGSQDAMARLGSVFRFGFHGDTVLYGLLYSGYEICGPSKQLTTWQDSRNQHIGVGSLSCKGLKTMFLMSDNKSWRLDGL